MSWAPDRLVKLKLVVIGLAAALLSGIWRSIFPISSARSLFEQPLGANQPSLLSEYLKLLHLLISFPANLALFAVFVFFAAYKCKEPRSWIYAVLARLMLSYVLS